MIKSAWDDSDEDAPESAPSTAPPAVAAPAGDEPAPPAADTRAFDPLIPEGATAAARLFAGAHRGSLDDIARALAEGATPTDTLTFLVLEELETHACNSTDRRGDAAVPAELGDTAMHVAVRAGRLEVVLLLLLAQPADLAADRPAKRNRRGETALELAAAGSPLRELLVASAACARTLRLQRAARGPADGTTR
jgi:hypothetical protein